MLCNSLQIELLYFLFFVLQVFLFIGNFIPEDLRRKKKLKTKGGKIEGLKPGRRRKKKGNREERPLTWSQTTTFQVQMPRVATSTLKKI